MDLPTALNASVPDSLRSKLVRVLGRLSTLVLAVLLVVTPAAGADLVAELDAGAGARLRVETSPFRIALLDGDGRERLATLEAGAPVRAPAVDGPQPEEPLGALGGHPALGWVAGARAGATIPVFLWAGNRLFGSEAGALVTVTGAELLERTPGGARLRLATSAGEDADAELTRLPGGGVRLRVIPPPSVPAVSSMFSLGSPEDEGLYGLGARKDRFDQRGVLRNVWVEQQNAGDERVEPVTGPDYTFPNGAQAAYFVQPALLGSRGWAVWTGGSALGRVDLAASRPDAIRWGTADPVLDVTFAAGGIEAASRAYTADTGRAPAPPRFVYEPWIDVINEGEGEAAPNGHGFSGGERVKADLREIVAKAKEHDLPIGVAGIEGWHTLDASFLGDLRRAGLRLAGYWNPFTAPGTPAHDEASRLDLFVKDPVGRPYEVLTSRNTLVNVIDFTHPDAAAFWARQLQRSRSLGMEAFMHDFGEFVTEGMTFHDGSPPELAHNRYPTLYHRAARAAIRAGEWFYVRAGFTGTTASTSGVFPGDETTDWAESSGLPSVIPAMLNLSLTGGYTSTTDVGGYFDFVAPRTTPELLTRWSQLAAFTPVLRLHNSTAKKSLMPWDSGDEHLAIFRRYAKAKVKLIGIIDRLSRRAAARGDVGPVRPMVLEDASLRSVDDQWMLGRDLLVAPVVRRGATERRVRLPAGAAWERVTVAADGSLSPTGDVQAGGRTVTAPAPLADIPLYIRVKRRCASRRRFGIRIHAARRPVVTVAGRRVKVRRAGRRRWRATVDLRGMPRRRAVVRIRVGGKRLSSRVYRTCVPG